MPEAPLQSTASPRPGDGIRDDALVAAVSHDALAVPGAP
ncbi:hypothetical protein EDD40_7999 [Saccharothrix texasensis]|uniref:Uncharacterized protein n=1 Tax=Saccharothrix texasensis TaxID=103734 RepID=A0A3N1HJ54_9PSEU|nr:hypothetical protein EDD40_7999 [Saccharothrix texasensis]